MGGATGFLSAVRTPLYHDSAPEIVVGQYRGEFPFEILGQPVACEAGVVNGGRNLILRLYRHGCTGKRKHCGCAVCQTDQASQLVCTDNRRDNRRNATSMSQASRRVRQLMYRPKPAPTNQGSSNDWAM